MKTAFIYPGQGAQYCGMGKDFYDSYDVSRKIYDKASQILKMDIPKLCFEENDLLNITEYTQVAIVTTCIAMYEVIKEKGIIPDISAGLSLGEYCALYTCGAVCFEDLIYCVKKRGLYMQEAVPVGNGAMSAVMGLSAQTVEDICNSISGIVAIANYNCPGQVVISGETNAVIEAGKLLEKEGALRVVPLKVSGPFHSEMLAGAGQKLSLVLENIELSPLNIPYIANVNADIIYEAAEVKKLLIQQVSSPVQWQQSVECMIQNGVTRFIEIGPGRTLKKFIKKISKEATVINVSKIEDLQNLGKLEGKK